MLVCVHCAQSDYYHTLCCSGWQSGGIHSLWFSLPDCRVASLGLGKVHYYSTSGSSKDGPPQSASGDAPSAEKVLSAAIKATPAPSGEELMCPYTAEVVDMLTLSVSPVNVLQ